MTFKKNIKILVLGLSFAILPVTIKGMEINTNEIRLNNEISKKDEKLLEKIEKKIKKRENKNFKDMVEGEIHSDILRLENIIEDLVELKERTNNRITKGAAKELLNRSSNLIVSLLEQNINTIINEDLKNIEYWKMYNYHIILDFFKEYKKILINIKKETTKINLPTKINELINKINNKLPNLFEKYILKIEKKAFKNYKNFTDFDFKENIEYLENLEQELINLEKETHNDEINIILNNAKNNIPKLLTNLYEKYIEKLKNENINSMTIYELKQPKDFLEKAQNALNNLKNSTNNLEEINKLNILINEIFKLIEKLIEKIKQKDNFNIKKNEVKQKFE